jgi:hypothetical protein
MKPNIRSGIGMDNDCVLVLRNVDRSCWSVECSYRTNKVIIHVTASYTSQRDGGRPHFGTWLSDKGGNSRSLKRQPVRDNDRLRNNR